MPMQNCWSTLKDGEDFLPSCSVYSGYSVVHRCENMTTDHTEYTAKEWNKKRNCND